MTSRVIHPVGPSALLVEVDDARTAAALAAWLREQRVDALDVVPAAGSVLLDGLRSPGTVRGLLASAPADAELAARHRAGDVPEPVRVPVRWDGPDLGVVADHWGVDEAEVVRRLEAAELTSAFCGFAPGFAYLAGLPGEWAVPRRDEPRSRVAPGSVALADTWCGIYPSASPGGWQLVGRTEAVLWDAAREQPALLAPGTPVRLVAREDGP